MVVELHVSSNSRFGRANFSVQWRVPTILCVHHVFETPRLDHNFIDDPLENEISEGRGYNSVLLDSYGRLADFDVLKIFGPMARRG